MRIRETEKMYYHRVFGWRLWLAIQLIVLQLIMLQAQRVDANDITPLVEYVDPYVMCIESLQREDGQLQKLTGTGVQIQPGLVVTVAHQVKNVDKIMVYRRDGQVSPGKVLALDEVNDLALLQIAQHPGGIQPVTIDQVTIGDKIFSVGCPFGFDHSLSRGYVKKPHLMLDGRAFIEMDMSIHTGDSGAPVFDSQRRWIGVVGGYWTKSQSIGFAMPVEKVLDMLHAAGYQRAETPSVPAVAKVAEVASIQTLWAQAEPMQGAEQQQQYEKIIRAVAHNARELKLQGLAQVSLGHTEQAIVVLGNYLRQVPDDMIFNVLLAEMLIGRERYEEALTYLLAAKQLKPEYATLYLYLGQVYDLGYANIVSAKASYEQFLRLSPNSTESYKVKRWLDKHKGS